jgi:hypothetical protein
MQTPTLFTPCGLVNMGNTMKKFLARKLRRMYMVTMLRVPFPVWKRLLLPTVGMMLYYLDRGYFRGASQVE